MKKIIQIVYFSIVSTFLTSGNLTNYIGIENFSIRDITNSAYIIFNLNSNQFSRNFEKKFIQNAKLDLVVFMDQTADNQKNLVQVLDLKYKGKLFIILQNVNVTSNFFKNLIKILAKNGIFNIIFVIRHQNNQEYFIWNAYSTKNSCGRYFNLETLNSSKGLNQFRNTKIPPSNPGCTLRITWLQAYPFVGNTSQARDPGLFLSLFNTLQTVSKIKIDYHFDPKFQNEFSNNGSLFKAMKYLTDDQTDVLIGHLFMNITDGIEFGPMFLQDRFIIVAPKPPPTKIYRRLLKAFNFDVWLVYILVFVVVSMVYSMISKWHGNPLEIGYVLMDNFRLGIGAGMNRLPIEISSRMLLLSYCLYVININSVYLGKLSGMLTLPIQGIQIIDPESMYVNNVYFNMSWYYERCMGLYQNINNEDWQRNVHIVNQTERDILKGVSHIINRSAITFNSIGKTYPYDTPLHGFIIADETKITLFITFFLRLNNILNPIVRYWSAEIVEKGFFAKWWDDIILHNTNYTLLREGLIEKENVVVLSLRHYEEAFLVLLYGYSMATGVLLMELLRIRIEKRLDYMKKNSIF